ncbi:MAG: GCN5-related N-acetyltransferase [Marmoricola sp.]|nr:GCN5-related N-acetyltransferase [Marmoricola sp.]
MHGETGPSGGPALTDVLGVMEVWASGRTSIRREDGSVEEFPTADIVSGKPVPPRPSRFARLSDDEVERRGSGMFTPSEGKYVGDWLFRHTGGTNGRPNSILPVGEPGGTLDEVLDQAAGFYAAHGRQPCAQVVVGSALLAELEARGWVKLHPDEADTDVLLAGIAQLSRSLRSVDTTAFELSHSPVISREWLVGNDRALANYEAVERSLRLSNGVFAAVSDNGPDGPRQLARGRVNLVDDWALFGDLTVQPEQRRRGLARVIMADLTEWAAERGASVMLLQVLGDNVGAQALYESMGFVRHHSYRYLVAP